MKRWPRKCNRWKTALLLVALLVILTILLAGKKLCNPDIVIPYDRATFGGVNQPDTPGGSFRMVCNSDGLRYYGCGGKVVLSDTVRNRRLCSWDGEKWIYYDEAKNAIFSWTDVGGEPQCLLDLSGKGIDSIDALFGVNGYLMLCSSTESYRYDEHNAQLKRILCPVNTSEWTFIYQDWLINLWGQNEQIIAYHVPTEKTVYLDIYRTGPVTGEFVTEAAFASDEQYLYLSLFLCGKLSRNIAIEGTYAINLETWETQCLSETYYGSLRRTENGLWGNGFIPIRLPDDAP